MSYVSSCSIIGSYSLKVIFILKVKSDVTGSNPIEALIFFRLLHSNCLNWKIYCDDHSSFSSTTAVQIWIISHILDIISLHGKIWTQQIDLAPSVWLHSSVGGASHRYRGGHGFESRSFQLHKLENLLRWSHFTFIYNRSTKFNMNYFIHTSQYSNCIASGTSVLQNKLKRTFHFLGLYSFRK